MSCQGLERLPGQGFHANEQAVDRISTNVIVVYDRANATVVGHEGSAVLISRLREEGFFEAVRVSADRGVCTLGDTVTENQWTSFAKLDRARNFRLRSRTDQSSTEGHQGIGDRVQENTFSFTIKTTLRSIRIVANFDSTPVSRLCIGRQWVCINAEGLVRVRREVDRQSRSSENLDCRTRAVNNTVTANHDSRSTEFHDRSSVDHQRDPLGNFQAITIGES